MRKLLAFAFVLLPLWPGVASADRPAPLKKPPGATPPGSMTEQKNLPKDPSDAVPPPKPKGTPCGPDPSHCDKDHPGKNGKYPGNQPPYPGPGGQGWYESMHQELTRSYWAFDYLAILCAQIRNYDCWYFATIARVESYYSHSYGFNDEVPIDYSFGHATRNDFSLQHYYFIRPIYFSLLDVSIDVKASGYPPGYHDALKEIAISYTRLTLCVTGFNGDDEDALGDIDDDPLLQELDIDIEE